MACWFDTNLYDFIKKKEYCDINYNFVFYLNNIYTVYIY